MPRIPFWIFVALGVLLFTGAWIDVMDIDASQYAEMSREMLIKGDFIHLYDRGADYLDKPPFLFWVSSLSMKIFGIDNFGYKLPSLLFALLAIYATYRLARILYDEQTGRIAALVLGTCQGMFLMTNDVRTDTILMGWVITAIWLLKEWDLKGKQGYLLGGAAAISFGMMTKGPIAMLVPAFSLGADWALKRDWRKFLDPRLFIGLTAIALLLIPMSIGLYQQFDLHPEKIIDGRQGVSGLRFFYWTQSFGRITGESTWSNGAGFEFLLVNMLWSFLPWIFLFLPALAISIADLFKQRFQLKPDQEGISIGGFTLTYIVLGSSHYQLPHYIFVAFPLAAILTAQFLKSLFEGNHERLYRIMRPLQTLVGFLVLVAALLTFAIVFDGNWLNYVAWAIGLGFWIFLVMSKDTGRLLWGGVAAIMIANVFMTNHFYRSLLKYQLGSNIGRLISERHLPVDRITIYNTDDPLNSLPFYARAVIAKKDSFPDVRKGDYLITMEREFDGIKARGFDYDTILTQSFFKVSELTPRFLSPATRKQSLKKAYLIRLK